MRPRSGWGVVLLAMSLGSGCGSGAAEREASTTGAGEPAVERSAAEAAGPERHDGRSGASDAVADEAGEGPAVDGPATETVAREPTHDAIVEKPAAAGTDGRALYLSYCGACHSLEVVQGQRLDRDGWDWVLDDMIREYGADWITGEERELIVDHLVRELGPDTPR